MGGPPEDRRALAEVGMSHPGLQALPIYLQALITAVDCAECNKGGELSAVVDIILQD